MHTKEQSNDEHTSRLYSVLETVRGIINSRFSAIAFLGIAALQLSHPLYANNLSEYDLPSDEVTTHNDFLRYYGVVLADALGIKGEGSAIVVFDSGIAPDSSFEPLFEACAAESDETSACTDGQGVHIGPGVAVHDNSISWHGDRMSHTAHVTAPDAEIVPVSIINKADVLSFTTLTAAMPVVLDYLKENYPDLQPVMMYAADAALNVKPGENEEDFCDRLIPDLTQTIQQARADGILFVVPLSLERLEPGQTIYPACIRGAVPVVGVEGYNMRLAAKDAEKIKKPMIGAIIEADVNLPTRKFVAYGHSPAVAGAAGMFARYLQAESMMGDEDADLLNLSPVNGISVYDEFGDTIPNILFLHARVILSALGEAPNSFYLPFLARWSPY